MGMEQKLFWKRIHGVVISLCMLYFASLVEADNTKTTKSCCTDGLSLNYTLPMFNECKKKQHPNGSMVQTIPKLIPYSSKEAACPRRKNKLGIPPGHRVCRFPDCEKNLCENGWCEETMDGYKCHCSTGFQGKHCDERSSTTGETTTLSTSHAKSSASSEATLDKITSVATLDATSGGSDATLESTSTAMSKATADTKSEAMSKATPGKTSDAMSETTAGATSLAMSKATSGATSGATLEATSGATLTRVISEATSEPTVSATSDATSDATSGAMLEATSGATSRVMSEATTEATGSATSDTMSGAALGTKSEATSGTTVSATSDTMSEATSESAVSARSDTTSGAASSAMSEATSESAVSATSDTTLDAASGALSEATSESAVSATSDTTSDATSDGTSTMSALPSISSSKPSTTSEREGDATRNSTTASVLTTPGQSQGSTMIPSTTNESSAKIFITDRKENAIFVADMDGELVFTRFDSSPDPHYVTYDSVDRKIYWGDKQDYQVYRANLDGTNKEAVTTNANGVPYGLAIAEEARTLYIAYHTENKITSLSIEAGSPFARNETDFVPTTTGYAKPRALEVDEKQGYLYWTLTGKVARKFLNGTGGIDLIYHNSSLRSISGLSIDFTRNERRIFFMDRSKERSFYKDVSDRNTSSARELTMEYPCWQPGTQHDNPTYSDLSYFSGALYWLRRNAPKGIGIMKNDSIDRSCSIETINEFGEPVQIYIAKIPTP